MNIKIILWHELYYICQENNSDTWLLLNGKWSDKFWSPEGFILPVVFHSLNTAKDFWEKFRPKPKAFDLPVGTKFSFIAGSETEVYMVVEKDGTKYAAVIKTQTKTRLGRLLNLDYSECTIVEEKV